MKEYDQLRDEVIQKFNGDLSLLPSQVVPKIYRSNKILIPKGKTLVFICAPSGSGKSTFCNKYFRDLKDVAVVNSDIVLAVNSRLKGYVDIDEVTQEWFKILERNLKNNNVVVSDSNNILIEMRAKMLKNLKNYYDHTVMIILDIPIETILKQLHKRNPESDSQRSIYEKFFLDIELEEPEKYFAGIDKVCIVKDVRKVQIELI